MEPGADGDSRPGSGCASTSCCLVSESSIRLHRADRFYGEMLPGARPDDSRILRQALAGMIWSKQFFHYDVNRWLTGDVVPVPPGRHHARNHQWRHFRAADIMSMPDTWEYPWFAAWDTAYHCAALA